MCALKLSQKWSIMAEVGLDFDEDWDGNSSVHLTRTGSQLSNEAKNQKILEWLQQNGIKEGSPSEFFENDEKKTQKLQALREKLMKGQSDILSRRKNLKNLHIDADKGKQRKESFE